MHWTLQWSFSNLSRYIFPKLCKETMFRLDYKLFLSCFVFLSLSISKEAGSEGGRG